MHTRVHTHTHTHTEIYRVGSRIYTQLGWGLCPAPGPARAWEDISYPTQGLHPVLRVG